MASHPSFVSFTRYQCVPGTVLGTMAMKWTDAVFLPRNFPVELLWGIFPFLVNND